MNKVIIVINGAGGVGKDTLCDFVAKRYPTMNVSSIDPIKAIAKLVGWQSKDLKGRAFLSKLKALCEDYYNYTTNYLIVKTSEFMESQHQVMFVHIREPEEIEKFIGSLQRVFSVTPRTLLVQRDTGIEAYGNASDDKVSDYCYDVYFDNNQSLEEAEEGIVTVVAEMLKEEN